MYNTLIYDKKDGYAVITLNRPDKLNALNAELLSELGSLLSEVAADASVRAVVITGSGAKAFAAGADIAQLHLCDAATGAEFALRGQAVFSAIEYLSKPVIAAVNGFALGGGCELALACHFRIASENARFGQPEVNLGIIPGYGGTQRLTKVVGRGMSTELILTGAMVDAARAERIGLVNRVVPQADLLALAEELAATIAAKPAPAIAASLECIVAADELSPAEGMNKEAQLFGATCGTADFKEGTLAFLEKRAAHFTHS